MIKIKLVGARRYTRDNKTYEANKVYALNDEQAENLLDVKDEWGNPYFEEASARDERELGTSEPAAPKEDPPGGKARRKTIRVGGDKAAKRAAANQPKQPKAKKSAAPAEGGEGGEGASEEGSEEV